MSFFRIPDPVSQTHIFESLTTIFWVEISIIIICKLAQIFFFPSLKLNIIFNFVIFVVSKKKVGQQIFFSPLSFVAVYLDPRDPAWTIRNTEH